MLFFGPYVGEKNSMNSSIPESLLATKVNIIMATNSVRFGELNCNGKQGDTLETKDRIINRMHVCTHPFMKTLK